MSNVSRTTDKRQQTDWMGGKNLDGFLIILFIFDKQKCLEMKDEGGNFSRNKLKINDL